MNLQNQPKIFFYGKEPSSLGPMHVQITYQIFRLYTPRLPGWLGKNQKPLQCACAMSTLINIVNYTIPQ